MADANRSYETFTAWLHRIHAREIFDHGTKTHRVTGYAVNGKTFIVSTIYEQKQLQGWFIYVPASDTNKTADEIDAAAARLGVEGCGRLLDSSDQDAARGL
jgi:hypothetical protein